MPGKRTTTLELTEDELKLVHDGLSAACMFLGQTPQDMAKYEALLDLKVNIKRQEARQCDCDTFDALPGTCPECHSAGVRKATAYWQCLTCGNEWQR